MKRLGIFFGSCLISAAAAAFGADFAPRDEARRAVDALTLHYLREGIYDPVDCDVEDGQERTWVRCTGVRSNAPPGGLFFLGHDQNGGLLIWAGNGKAIQHLKSRSSLSDADNKPIPAARWTGDPVNLKDGLSAFGIE